MFSVINVKDGEFPKLAATLTLWPCHVLYAALGQLACPSRSARRENLSYFIQTKCYVGKLLYRWNVIKAKCYKAKYFTSEMLYGKLLCRQVKCYTGEMLYRWNVIHTGEMWYRWNVIQVKCYKGEMLYRWNVIKVKCYTGELLYRWNVIKVKCYTGEMLYRWNVIKVKCYTGEMLCMQTVI